MKVSRDKINICMARKKMSVAAGRLADALGCDVTDILE